MAVREQSDSDTTFTIPIDFNDGTSMEATAFNADNKDAPVCICLPAMGVRAEYYKVLAMNLANQGITVVTCDLRGHGQSSIRADRQTNFGYAEILNIDLPTIIAKVKNRLDCKKVLIMGHSLGGQIGLLYASQSTDVEGVIMIASGSNWYRNMSSSWKRNGRYVGYYAIKMLNMLFGYFPGTKFKFAGTEARQLITDWLHESLTGKYRVEGSTLDYEALLFNTRLHVLFVSFKGDTYVTELCSLYLASKLQSAHVEHVSLSPESVGLKQACHFRWASRPEIIVEKICDWQQNLPQTN